MKEQRPDQLDEDEIRNALRTRWAGREINIREVTQSTNSDARELAEQGAPHGTLVLAHRQTAGRGRRGRVWQSGTEEGLYMTLLLKPQIRLEQASMLTLVMGMAARDAIERVSGLPVQIKWPNDIVWEGRKVCGILAEMGARGEQIRYIVIGIGVNVSNAGFDEELKDRAVSIFQSSGRQISRCQLAAEILNAFEPYYETFLTAGDMSRLMLQYNEQLVNTDRKVRVEDVRQNFTGTALGIDEKGNLMVATENEVRRVTAGEVSVRGIYGYV